ncbi:MAG: nicotinamide-nucleotide adenylyltransferase [Candidatus Woesearchaeota archaeon]
MAELNIVTIRQGCVCGRDIKGNRKIKFLCRHCNVLYDTHMTGLYIGRFQPFHNGHLEVVKKATEEVDKLIIVVARPLRRTEQDPFSAEERKDMIEKTLSGYDNVIVRIVNDIPSDDEYVQHVRENVPPFNVVYVGDNKLNEELFRGAGYKIITSERYFGLDATHVREAMRKGREWKAMVPENVAEYIEEKGLKERVITADSS